MEADRVGSGWVLRPEASREGFVDDHDGQSATSVVRRGEIPSAAQRDFHGVKVGGRNGLPLRDWLVSWIQLIVTLDHYIREEPRCHRKRSHDRHALHAGKRRYSPLELRVKIDPL